MTVDWHAYAACAQTDPELFFPPPGVRGTRARLVCITCPVRVECLDDALRNRDVDWGIRGGLDAKQRQNLLLRRAGLRR